MDSAPLDPCHLTPAASLNRVPLQAPDGEIVKAFDLLSAAALAELVRREAGPLGLPAVAASPRDLPTCLESPDPGVREAAEGIAEEYGSRLGMLLGTLRSGDGASRAARPEWDDSYWDRWARTTTVVLGGGLVCGSFGRRVADKARGAGCRVTVAAHPDSLPLIGAARGVGAGSRAAAVLDLGHSWVKRAVAHYDDGVLVSLQRLPPVPAPANPAAPGSVDEVGRQLAMLVAATWAEASGRGPVSARIVGSVAAYLLAGQPVPAQLGTYAELATLSGNLARWLSAAAGARLRTPVSVELVHDGTAAAHAVPPDDRTAVVMLGTALGVGYPHPCAALRPVSSRLEVRVG